MKVLRTLALVAVSLALVTACAASVRPNWTPTLPSATQPHATAAVATTTTLAPPATPVSTHVLVTLDDTMKIAPDPMTVPAGQPITFVVTNVGRIAHEFTLGDAAVQDEHEQEMMSMGGAMAHDEDNAISVAPGQTKELTYTFEMPGMSLAACHVPGHYPAGMKAAITVTS